MKSYIFLIFFLLRFYYSICDGTLIRSDGDPQRLGKKYNWLSLEHKLRAKKRYTTTESKELVYSSLSPLDLEEYRNLTALKYWTRDDDFFENGRKVIENTTKTMRSSNLAKNRTLQLNPVGRRIDGTTKKGANVERRQTVPASTRTLGVFRDTSGMNGIISAHHIKREVDEILGQFTDISSTTQKIGRTIEYQDILLIKATKQAKAFFRAEDQDKYIDEKPEKKIIFIVHGLSVMGIKYLPCFRRKSHFKKLLSFYFEHLDKFDIYLMPMANPDGYTRVMSRLITHWNKNFSPQDACQGVAVDRNFDVAWNSTPPVSSCSQQYPGSSPFSEPESKAVRDILHRYGHKIVAYINVHAGTYDVNTVKGDAVLYPKGFTDIPGDDDKYVDLRGEIDEAMKNASFEKITVAVNTLHSWYGKIAGSSVDYAATVYGVPYALEFVMQVYNSDIPNSQSDENEYGESAMNEIWARVIKTVFDNIYKTVQSANDK